MVVLRCVGLNASLVSGRNCNCLFCHKCHLIVAGGAETHLKFKCCVCNAAGAERGTSQPMALLAPEETTLPCWPEGRQGFASTVGGGEVGTRASYLADA